MKYFSLTIVYLGTSLAAIAQNVGIGTQTPHASAQLDVSSTTRGLLAPRMTTAQRNAIASPAKGLLVYDTQVNSLFHYNGNNWVNLSNGGGGGSLTLPYTASVDLNTNVLSITNAGLGAAIHGVTTNEFGYAVSGISNSAFGYGIFGYANAPDAVAVYGNTGEGTAVKGHSTGGLGMDARSTNNSALKASILLGANPNPTIRATHAGEGDGIEASSIWGSGVKGTTTSSIINEAGVFGINNGTATGNGVLGEANSAQAIGVNGRSTNGTGVQGSTNSGTAVRGFSSGGVALYGSSGSSGTAIRGESANGYGLQVSGNLRLYGGNTNPEPGAVLTSTDGIGNAVWKKRNIAFKAHSPYSSLLGFPSNASSRKLHFGSESYDYGGNFTSTTSGSPTADMSTFTVPVSGLYHFDLGIKVKLDDIYDDFEVCYAFIRLIRDGADYMLHFMTTECCNANLGYEVGLYGSTDVQLQTGDKVYVIFYQRNDDDAVGKLVGGLETYFNGHLVFTN